MKQAGLIYVIFIFIMPSCNTQNEGLPVFTKTDLPVSKGSYWIYWYHNYLNGQEYPLTLTIADVALLTPDTQIISYRLTYDSLHLIDSAIGILTESTFTYKSITNTWTQLGDYSLHFPLMLGNEWVGIDSSDTLHVVLHADKYNITNHLLNNVFNIHSYNRKGINVITNSIYVAQGVGIVAKSLVKVSGNILYDRNNSYTLVDYHIR